MGGNRRNRGGNNTQNQHHNRNNKVDNATGSPNKTKAGIRDPYQENDVILAEIERGLNVSWKDICYFAFAIFVMLAYGGVAGIAAGTSLSVHYFERSLSEGSSPNTRGSSSAQFGLMPNPSASRITSVHSASFSANRLPNGQISINYQKNNFRTGVMPSTSFGSVETLMLVEESVPLGIETNFAAATDRASSETACNNDENNDKSGSCVVDDSNNNIPRTMSRPPEQQTDDGSSPKLSTAQAKLYVSHYDEWLKLQPKFLPPDPMIKPTTCQDGSSGFDNWKILRNAIHEANSISEERSALWSSYFARDGRHLSGVFHDDTLYYEEDMIFRICPGETLRGRRGSSITVNAANLVLECQDCIVDVGGTHLAFGPRAKNTLVKGITFRGATSSSLTFFHHGSDAIFEDCTWIGNTGISKKNGAVADLNSTSTVKFYRCSIGYGNKKTWYGGRVQTPGSSSLSIRA